MRVFVTGASGFVGSAVVKELLQAGHQVLGMVRSDSGAEAVKQAGAEPFRGDIYDLDSLKKGASQCDAVIHTAFNHDFTKFKDNCETDRQVIMALGAALAGTNKPLVVTSGVGLLNYGREVNENDKAPGSDVIPRAASEEAAYAVAEQGVNSYIVRLPPSVHAAGDHGFVPVLIGIAKEKGAAAYIGEGNNQWPAVHRLDAAVLYRLIIEKQPAQKVYHAVGEQGIPFKQITAAIGKALQVPVVSKEGADAEAHFGWFKYFASIGCPASSEQTQATLGWKPVHPGLIEELVPGIYF
ncbi:3-beta hydroxysteroid dehydrogenase [Niastella koreensis]|uniref:NAD-dependent epimerase/dehydratase n=2 Tax=Niastella koreensis TaxID=354356 RepID=G8TND9_NIAKG|nr:SDR family oxidoreductase [Niastella koreensis]AEV98841.1 NAD-dependent epimerase/dehydratase [Niastella koreensis GR20-10]OQP43775.1 3-beta hydroxysteroid dehydrogenase [Niastella koreensis]